MDIKKTAIEAANKAAEILIQKSKEKNAFTMKNAHDIQTEVDLLSEKTIISTIKKHFPEHSIFAEESGKQITSSDYLWVIDPLDGTINYSRGIHEVCIIIAVQHKEEIIFDLIYQPFTKDLYIAEKGKGAFHNNKKLTVSKETELINMIIATENSSHMEKRKETHKILSNICDKFRNIRIFGCGALTLTKLASGKIDLFFKTKYNHWDFAAGALLVEEAGGTVTDLQGNPITQHSKEIVATNALKHKEILELLNKANN